MIQVKHLPHNPNFKSLKGRKLWKTQLEKEKLLVTSISPFLSVSCSMKERDHQFNKISFDVCKCFQFGPA